MEQQEIVSSKNACQQKFTQQCTVKAKNQDEDENQHRSLNCYEAFRINLR